MDRLTCLECKSKTIWWTRNVKMDCQHRHVQILQLGSRRTLEQENALVRSVHQEESVVRLEWQENMEILVSRTVVVLILEREVAQNQEPVAQDKGLGQPACSHPEESSHTGRHGHTSQACILIRGSISLLFSMRFVFPLCLKGGLLISMSRFSFLKHQSEKQVFTFQGKN